MARHSNMVRSVGPGRARQHLRRGRQCEDMLRCGGSEARRVIADTLQPKITPQALTEPEPIFEGAVSDRNDRRHRDLKGRGLCPRETGDVKDFHRGGSDIGVDHTIHWDSGDLGAVDPAVLSRAASLMRLN